MTRRWRSGSSAIRRSPPRRPSSTSRPGNGRSRSGRARPARSRSARSTIERAPSSRRGPARRWRGRWRAEGPAPSAARRSTPPWVWLLFCGVFLLGLADLRRPRSLRNLDLLALLSFTVSLRLFNEGEIFWSAPLAYPPLVYLLVRCLWIARRDRPPRASKPLWPVWVLAAAAVFLAGFRVGLNIEAPRSTIDVGFAGVIGGQRIVERPGSLRQHAGAGRPEGVRSGRRERRDPRADPDERPLRGLERARRHVRARLLSRVRPGLPRLRLDRKVGRALGRSCDLAPLRRTLPRRPRARRASLRRQPPRRDARLRLGRVSVHALRLELEHERRDHAGVPDLRLLARLVRLGARGRRSPSPAGRSSLRSCSRRSGSPTRTRSAGRSVAGARASTARASTALPGAGLRGSPSPRWRRSRSSCSSPIRSTRRGSSASGPSASSSTASRRSRSGAGGSTARRESPTSTSSSRCSRWCSSQRARGARLRAAPPLAAPARGPLGRSPDRLRARADALVLSLHPVVLSLRRLRRPERP